MPLFIYLISIACDGVVFAGRAVRFISFMQYILAHIWIKKGAWEVRTAPLKRAIFAWYSWVVSRLYIRFYRLMPLIDFITSRKIHTPCIWLAPDIILIPSQFRPSAAPLHFLSLATSPMHSGMYRGRDASMASRASRATQLCTPESASFFPKR